MSVRYQAVLWNRQKRRYDFFMLGLIVLYLGLFSAFQGIFHPEITAETLLIRATGTLAILMLHVILSIGPLSRMDDRFLPLLYNRRHMGVTMSMFALAHGVLSLIQFHALGDINPLVSLFTSNVRYDSLHEFPFQVLGFFALLIIMAMSTTSHDFWLKNLGPKVWKRLHMLVYVAYGLLILHVMLGAFQAEGTPGVAAVLGLGMVSIIGLHLVSAFRVKRQTVELNQLAEDGFVQVCEVGEIAENCAKVILVGDENIAIFKYDGKLSAINNVCKHQNGPLGEGQIVDGCITCPWHGYQYLPDNGQSPPPFKEKVTTYDVKLVGTTVWVNPSPHPEGTYVEPALITHA